MSANGSGISNAACLSYVCRLCLGSTEANMGQIFLLAEKLEFVTKLAVHEKDGLPPFICNRCVVELDMANAFIHRSVTNDSILRTSQCEPYLDESIVVKEEELQAGDAVPPVELEFVNCAIEVVTLDAAEDAGDQVEAGNVFLPTDDFPSSSPLLAELAGECSFHASISVANCFEPSSDTSQAEPSVNESEGNAPRSASPSGSVADKIYYDTRDESCTYSEQDPRPASRSESFVHVETISDKEDEFFPCNLCGESFNMKSYLNFHLRSHAKYVPSKAGVPGQSAAAETVTMEAQDVSEPDLQVVQDGDMSFKEEITPRSTCNRARSQVEHVCYNCLKCGEKFESESSLKSHTKQHIKLLKRVAPLRSAECGETSVPKPAKVARKDAAKAPLSKSPVRSSSNEIGKQQETNARLSSRKKNQSLRTELREKQTVAEPDKKPEAVCFPCATSQGSFQGSFVAFRHRHERTLVVHARTHAKKLPARCPECGQRFADAPSLEEHKVNVHTSEEIFTCRKCGEEFGNALHLTRHSRFHKEEKPYKCVECGASFVDEVRLLSHFKVHAVKVAEAKFECGDCDEVFRSRERLASHVMTHAVKKETQMATKAAEPVAATFTCDKCDKSFPSSECLASHVTIHAVEKANQEMSDTTKAVPRLWLFKCDKCDKVFVSRASLASHLVVHTREKGKQMTTDGTKAAAATFKCDKCNKVYASKGSLANHLKSHTAKIRKQMTTDGTKAAAATFKYDKCDKVFARKGPLANHLKSHTAKMATNAAKSTAANFKCDTCNKLFPSELSLANHTTTHDPEVARPWYTCSHCDRGFPRMDSLTNHLKTHAPVKCKTCGEEFDKKNLFQKHMRLHKEKYPYECGTCGKVFAKELSLLSHYQSHVRKDVNDGDSMPIVQL